MFGWVLNAPMMKKLAANLNANKFQEITPKKSPEFSKEKKALPTVKNFNPLAIKKFLFLVYFFMWFQS